MNSQDNGPHPFVLLAALDLADTDSGGYALDHALRVATRIPGCEMMSGVTLLGVGAHVRMGEPAHVIAELAADIGADLVIVGTHRVPQLRTMMRGHTGERVTSESSCPVLTAGPRPKPEASHVIVIEGPCPDCLAARQSTGRRAWWCARHSEHHRVLRHHLYAYEAEFQFAQHDSEVTATGAD